jgi:uncharacterized membrane protein YcaP (DUF421 family)
MDLISQLFGEGKELTALQMSMRGIVIFVIALLLIRISGRRSFGLSAPFDNIITILLGAVLSRAVVGASPFWPVVVCCLVIVLLHRLLGLLVSKSERFASLIEGNKMLLFDKGHFIEKNLKKAQVCKEDILQGVRESALTDDPEKIDRIYIERSGTISALKKE